MVHTVGANKWFMGLQKKAEVALAVSVVLLLAATTVKNEVGGDADSYGYVITCCVINPGIHADGNIVVLSMCGMRFKRHKRSRSANNGDFELQESRCLQRPIVQSSKRLAMRIPEFARLDQDGLYRAIYIYLKVRGTRIVQDNDTNIHTKEPLVINHDEPVESNEVLTKDQPQKTDEPVVRPTSEVQTPPIPFPQRLRKEKEEAQQKKFLENLKQLHINLPFIEALAQMPKYAKFLKGLLTNRARLEEACTITMNERCSAVLLNKLPLKEKDPGSFTIPCDIGQLHINNALADLGASISLMPYTMYEKLGLGEPKATRMSLELADRSIQYPRGIVENVLIKVDKFVLLIDFVILDMPEDSRVPIILGRPFLATARAMIDVFNKKITLRVGDDEVIFDMDQSIKRSPNEDDECY
ncbi:reverse transcriptase domain-containing protein [Tanacetum coccineum]